MRDFTKIQAWRLADDFTVAVYQRSRVFPREELYGLTSQIRRSAASIAANIAEGSSRESKRDYLHFLYIARGSLAETRYFIHLAERLAYLAKAEAAELADQGRQTFGCLHGLIQAVEKEAGKLVRIAAAVTSFIALAIIGFSFRGPSSLVSGL